MKKFDGMLILSDMDGTILDDNKQISEENKTNAVMVDRLFGGMA